VIIIPNTSREYRRSSIERAESTMQRNGADDLLRVALAAIENPSLITVFSLYPQHPEFFRPRSMSSPNP
jgi:hypothetical protein